MGARRPRHLYHLTPIENLAAVLAQGLRASEDGAIYAFTDTLVANTIACHQVFVMPGESYAILEIVGRGAITGEVLTDDVGEFSAPYQRRIMQAEIAPKHLRHLGNFEAVWDRPLTWDFLVGKMVYGETPEQTRERWLAVARMQRGEGA